MALGYDSVSSLQPDLFTHLLDEIRRTETELGHLPQKWKLLWERLEPPPTAAAAAAAVPGAAAGDTPAHRLELAGVRAARAFARDVHRRTYVTNPFTPLTHYNPLLSTLNSLLPF